MVALNLKHLIPALHDQLFSVAVFVRNKLVVIEKKRGLSRRVPVSVSRKSTKITHY